MNATDATAVAAEAQVSDVFGAQFSARYSQCAIHSAGNSLTP